MIFQNNSQIFQGLSTNTKPVSPFCSVGDKFFETDTLKLYEFSPTEEWKAYSGGGGGLDEDVQMFFNYPMSSLGTGFTADGPTLQSSASYFDTVSRKLYNYVKISSPKKSYGLGEYDFSNPAQPKFRFCDLTKYNYAFHPDGAGYKNIVKYGNYLLHVIRNNGGSATPTFTNRVKGYLVCIDLTTFKVIWDQPFHECLSNIDLYESSNNTYLIISQRTHCITFYTLPRNKDLSEGFSALTQQDILFTAKYKNRILSSFSNFPTITTSIYNSRDRYMAVDTGKIYETIIDSSTSTGYNWQEVTLSSDIQPTTYPTAINDYLNNVDENQQGTWCIVPAIETTTLPEASATYKYQVYYQGPNPKTNKWYEYEEYSDSYVGSFDTKIEPNKTYYTIVADDSTQPAEGTNPANQHFYELSSNGWYQKTGDTTKKNNKTYYLLTGTIIDTSDPNYGYYYCKKNDDDTYEWIKCLENERIFYISAGFADGWHIFDLTNLTNSNFADNYGHTSRFYQWCGKDSSNINVWKQPEHSETFISTITGEEMTITSPAANRHTYDVVANYPYAYGTISSDVYVWGYEGVARYNGKTDAHFVEPGIAVINFSDLDNITATLMILPEQYRCTANSISSISNRASTFSTTDGPPITIRKLGNRLYITNKDAGLGIYEIPSSNPGTPRFLKNYKLDNSTLIGNYDGICHQEPMYLIFGGPKAGGSSVIFADVNLT